MSKHTTPSAPPASTAAGRAPGGKPPSPPEGPIGTRIAQLMNERGMNQSELSRATDIPQSRLSNLIRGKTQNPPLARLKRIAEALGVGVSDITSSLDSETAADQHDETRGVA